MHRNKEVDFPPKMSLKNEINEQEKREEVEGLSFSCVLGGKASREHEDLGTSTCKR